ncbi:MAG: hypothetical protein ABSD78_19860 [Acidimicrobiales bacterium]|jgi:hypothetical protein
MERTLGDEDLAADVRDPRKHSSPHHPPDRVLGDLQDLGALGDCVNGRLASAEAVQVRPEAAADRPFDSGLDEPFDAVGCGRGGHARGGVQWWRIDPVG